MLGEWSKYRVVNIRARARCVHLVLSIMLEACLTFSVKSSYIAGTNGYSHDIVPMLRAYGATARYVDQGGSKRRTSWCFRLRLCHLHRAMAC